MYISVKWIEIQETTYRTGNIISVKWIEIQETTYRTGNMVITDQDNSLVPVFSKIINILLIGSERTYNYLFVQINVT